MPAWNPKRLLVSVAASAAVLLSAIANIRTVRERATQTINEEKMMRKALQEILCGLLAEISVLRENWGAMYAKGGAINSNALESKLKLIGTLRNWVVALQDQEKLVPIPRGRRAAAHAAKATATLTKLLARADDLTIVVRRQQEDLLMLRNGFANPSRK